MKRLVITENEQKHIRKLYSINEIDAEKVVSGLFDYAQKIAKGETTPQSDTTTPNSSDIVSGTEVPEGLKGKLSSPLKKFEVGTKFGAVRPGIDTKKPHSGVDLRASQGDEVFAPSDGVVTISDKSGWNGGCGGTLYIKHPDGYESRFCHLSDIFVSKNQQVRRGERVALVGGAKGTRGAGFSTGAHLHYTLAKPDGTLDDPEKYVDQKFFDIQSNKTYLA